MVSSAGAAPTHEALGHVNLASVGAAHRPRGRTRRADAPTRRLGPPHPRSPRPASLGSASWPASAPPTRPISPPTEPPTATRASSARWRSAPRRPSTKCSTSKLVGRGGAAFPTGRKWAAVAQQPARPHYLVCNADESEPGTFKDRVLMERDPFAVLEGMTIAAFAADCERGYLYIRGEYPDAEATMARRDRAGDCCEPPGAGHPRLRLRLRGRDPARRRRLHLRRGDGTLQQHRGQARRAAQQAALPGRGRPLRQADRRQQRRDAGQRAAHPARGRRGLRTDRHGGLDRPQALLPLGQRRPPGRLRGRLRGHARRPHRPGRRGRRTGARSRRSCSAARPASSSGQTSSTCR